MICGVIVLAVLAWVLYLNRAKVKGWFTRSDQ